MAARLQSPSSINTYKQCPRKYFYQYIRKFPTYPNIHTLRGNIVHSTLEKFFELNLEDLNDENYKKEMAYFLKNLFSAFWAQKTNSLQKLGLGPEDLMRYYEESTMMLANYLNHFFERLEAEKELSKTDIKGAFEKLKPTEIELQVKDADLSVRGFIDYIEERDGVITIMDYKTSKRFNMTKEYMLQLGIYALLYEKVHNVKPDKVGIWFLKDQPKIIDVDDDLIKNALFEIEQIHASTETQVIGDYPVNITPLCKYSTGQCDFYDVCIKDR